MILCDEALTVLLSHRPTGSTDSRSRYRPVCAIVSRLSSSRGIGEEAEIDLGSVENLYRDVLSLEVGTEPVDPHSISSGVVG